MYDVSERSNKIEGCKRSKVTIMPFSKKKKKRVCREQPRILISKSVHLFTSRTIGGVQGQLELGVTPQILKYVLFLYKK
jgi:hypothetical protein